MRSMIHKMLLLLLPPGMFTLVLNHVFPESTFSKGAIDRQIVEKLRSAAAAAAAGCGGWEWEVPE